MAQDKNNNMILFLSANKFKKTESHPTHTGNGFLPRDSMRLFAEKFKESGLDQIEIECSAWPRENSNGKYMQIIIKPKYEKKEGSKGGGKSSSDDIFDGSEQSDDDGLPFL